MSFSDDCNPTLTPKVVARLIAAAARQGMEHLLPLLRMMGEGRLALVFIPRGAETVQLATSGHPMVAILQDDDHASAGPDAFPVALEVLGWAPEVMFHAAGGEPTHYEAAGHMAMLRGGLCIVETSTAFLPAWYALAIRAARPGKLRGLVILPHGGAMHPQDLAVMQ